jgi:hypothetical protein
MFGWSRRRRDKNATCGGIVERKSTVFSGSASRCSRPAPSSSSHAAIPPALAELKRASRGKLRPWRCRPANVLQCLFAQQVGVALTGFGKLDDLVGDGLFDEIVGAFGSRFRCLRRLRGLARDRHGASHCAATLADLHGLHGAFRFLTRVANAANPAATTSNFIRMKFLLYCLVQQTSFQPNWFQPIVDRFRKRAIPKIESPLRALHLQ